MPKKMGMMILHKNTQNGVPSLKTVTPTISNSTLKNNVTPKKQVVSTPINENNKLGSGMINRISNARAGCSSCGRRK